MEIDYQFLKELVNVFNGKIGLNASEFIVLLRENGVPFEEEKSDTVKFIRHMEYLVTNEVIINTSGEKSLGSCGFRVAIPDTLIISSGNTMSVNNKNINLVGNGAENSVEEVFISHSEEDHAFALALHDLLITIGLKESQIFLSSISGGGIPLGVDPHNFMQEKINESGLVLFLLSENFFNSPYCLCEMGASWGIPKDRFSFVIPPFTFSDSQKAVPIGQSSTLNDKGGLYKLKKAIEKIFELEGNIDSQWERKRDEWLQSIEKLINNQNIKVESKVEDTNSNDLKIEMKRMLLELYDCGDIGLSEIELKSISKVKRHGDLEYFLNILLEKSFIGREFGSAFFSAGAFEPAPPRFKMLQQGREYVYENFKS